MTGGTLRSRCRSRAWRPSHLPGCPRQPLPLLSVGQTHRVLTLLSLGKKTEEEGMAVDLLPAQGTFGHVWDMFGCHNWGKGCHWHLVSKGQECCSAPHRAQDSPRGGE
ncbi:zinc finger protein 354C isoform X4 [Pongo abelii]|uniref:zinc finger protein 354C isoform X4 n=1 Tax=Pongo abelii TaxID=9601 RepID=UPI0030073F86